MRKNLLALSLVALAGSAFAQTTITAADQPMIMEVFQQATDTTQTQSEGASGTGQTYAFTGLLNQGQDSVTFTAPQWTPDSATFTSSNICIQVNTGDAYIYANMTGSILEINGQAMDPFGGGMIAVTFADPETQMIFPASLGSSFTDLAGGTSQFYLGYDPGIGFTIDSVRIHTYINKTSNYDGDGTLQSPLGTFNVLRQNTFRKQIDTIDIYAFGSWAPAFYSQVDSARTYSYWANNIGYPVVELTDQDDLGQITEAKWLVSNPAVTGIPTNHNDHVITAYPNPVADVLTIQTVVENGSIEIIDMTGRVVKTATINSTTTRLDLSDLTAGMYTYRVVGTAQQGKVQVVH